MDFGDGGECQTISDFPAQQPPASTLLPAPVASAVSLVARSSSLYLRLGTFVGGLALDGARFTTLTGLELSRAVFESILSRAGRDVTARSTGDLGRAEAEGLLERSIATLHSTITKISFAASTGFYFSAAALASANDLSQQLLTTLDSILGSTDSSRAIASIITLIRREFQNPETGVDGEKVSVADLLLGICGLALLQRWCRKLTDAESRQQRYEEAIWDVVIFDEGRRADVVGMNPAGSKTDKRLTKVTSRGALSFVGPSGDEVLDTIERPRTGQDDSDEDMPEIDLKQRIMQSLPADASVSITTSTTTTKTITVEITGAQPPDFSPPPGVEIIEENAHHTANVDLEGPVLTNEQKIGLLIPRYRVVYRIIRNKLRGTNIEAQGAIENANEIVSHHDLEEVYDVSSSNSIKDLESPSSMVSPASSINTDYPPDLSRRRGSRPRSLNLNEGRRSPATAVSSLSSKSVDSGDEGTLEPAPASAKGVTENIANEKRTRKSTNASSSASGSNAPAKKLSGRKSPSTKKLKSEKPPTKPPTEKKPSFRNPLRKGSGSGLLSSKSKESPAHGGGTSTTHGKPSQQRPPWGGASLATPVVKSYSSQVPVPQRGSSAVAVREAPRAPQRGNPNYFSSRDLGVMQQSQQIPRSPSKASFYSIHERRRDSLVSQTDTYSIHTADQTGRPESPATFRSHLQAQSSLLRARSEKNITLRHPPSPAKIHRRNTSMVPSIYTLKTSNSNTSLVLASHQRRSAFDDSETLESLMRTGFVDGLFPQHHIVRNITRFVRFASASYGANFLRVMGITKSKETSDGMDAEHHYEHNSFSSHTQLPADTILLSSFVDPQGGTDSTGQTNTGVPMVHFVSLDHDSKAVILTCRGTLGFEDVLTDMTCDYDEIIWREKAYKVHKGIHASASRLLHGGGGRVLATLKAALEEFVDYGLVMCGHSLGGAVAALLATMVSEPASIGPAFVTSEYQRPQLLLTSGGNSGITPSTLRLPPGRPIHVYAYGPPATMSPSLRLATRGLITTIVNGQDLVPYLSLGVLHDLQAVALAFKTDDSGAKGEVRNRVWAGFTSAFADKWYGNQSASIASDEDDQWAYSALKALRASMLSSKLLPPGEIFIVEAMPVLKRNAFVARGEERGPESLGRPATRSILKYVRNVERRFGEVRFGGSMLLDHSPGRYEASLGALRRGVLDG